MKHLISLFTSLFLMVCSLAYGQMNSYRYQRQLDGVTEQWHKMLLPDSIFGKVSQGLSDIRVYGLTPAGDTIEAPYLLRVNDSKVSSKSIAFDIINSTRNSSGYYFTFEVTADEAVNQIKLDFAQDNFDWRIDLEGSQDQREWFRIVDKYRILSIKNSQTDFQFTNVRFRRAKYRYFRLRIKSRKKPVLRTARIIQYEMTDGQTRDYAARVVNVRENNSLKQTEVDVEWPLPLRLSKLKITVIDSIDYYRPVTIQHLVDSFQTEKGWHYNYRTLTSGTLNSLEENDFHFADKTIQKVKILIKNHDNRPLSIAGVSASGDVHELIVRISDSADYYLVYGKKYARQPQYDIARFTSNIPDQLRPLTVGYEQRIVKPSLEVVEPLFKNKIWLWAVMTIIVVVLLWLTVRMMKRA